MKIKILGMGMLCLMVINSFAQSGITAPGLNKSIIAPSPEAASMVKYGLIPTTLYSGMANVSVPLCELKSGGLSVPVTISYNYNGYRPGEEASSVGLGWTLSGGGVITRMIKGKLDEDPILNYHWDDFANIPQLENDMTYMADLGEGRADGEPDLYMFNFNGHSGKFILVGDVAFTFPRQDIVIKRYGTNGFTIIDESGTSYEFTEKENTSQTNPPLNYTSAWHLTKMVSADKSDEITFEYTTWSHSLARAYSDVYTVKICGACPGSCIGANTSCDSYASSLSFNGNVGAKLLSKITGKNGYIDFILQGTTRLDLTGAGREQALKEIKLYSNTSGLLKTISFTQGYFGDNAKLKLSAVEIKGNYGLAAGQSSGGGIYNFAYANESSNEYPVETKNIDRWGYYNGKNNQMLFESSIVGGRGMVLPAADRSVDATKSINGALTKITYPSGGYTTFAYEPNYIANMPAINPDGTSVCSNGNTLEQKTVVCTGTGGYITSTAPLDIDACSGNATPKVKIEIGQNMVDPTGNPVKNLNSILSIYYVGPNETSYDLVYKSQLINTMESFTEFIDLPPGNYRYTVTCDNATGLQNKLVSVYVKITYYKLPAQGNTSTNQPGPGLRIKTISSYDGTSTGTPSFKKEYTYNTGATLMSANGYNTSALHKQSLCGSGDNSSDVYTTTSDYSSPVFTLMNNQFYYPSVTESNSSSNVNGKTDYEYAGGYDALGIFLKKQTDYKYTAPNTYIKLKETTSDYANKTFISFAAMSSSLYYIVENIGSNYCQYEVNVPLPDPYDVVRRTKLYRASTYTLTSAWNQLNTTTETVYDESGSNPSTTVTNYFYENPNHLKATKIVTTNSKDEEETVRLKYPLDYYTSGGSLYGINTIVTIYNTGRTNVNAGFGTCWDARNNAAYTAKTTYCPTTNNWDCPQLAAVVNPSLPAYTCTEYYKTDYINVKGTLFLATNALYSEATNISDPNNEQSARNLMVGQNITTSPVEVISSIKKGTQENLLGAIKTQFRPNVQFAGGSSNKYGISPYIIYQTPLQQNTLLSTFTANPSAYYIPKINFTYDGPSGNLITQNKVNDTKLTYLWDYNKQYPIAQATNADAADIAYTSFEASGKGNWAYSGAPDNNLTDLPTGSYFYKLSKGNITLTGYDPAKTYVISYWVKANVAIASVPGTGVKGDKVGVWTYFEHEFQPSGTTITISGTAWLDELRFYPAGAQMATYTYDPLMGLTSACDANNKISYYEYDGAGRLNLIRDPEHNLIKKFCYNYAGQAVDCGAAVYYNQQQSGDFYRSNCSSGYYGTKVTYTVPAFKYSSSVSVAAANTLAVNDVNANGQAYANDPANGGVCKLASATTINSVNNVSVSGFTAKYTNAANSSLVYTYTIPNTGGVLTTSLPAGMYNLNISKTGNATPYLFQPGCGSLTIGGTAANFYNIEVSSTTCNTITISDAQ